MSDTISFNTNEIAFPKPIKVKVEPFKLVGEYNQLLRTKSKAFDFNSQNANEFASRLVETAKLHKCLSLSSNECGYDYRVFVMGLDDNYVAFFNPKIIESSVNEVLMQEVCVSFPLLSVGVKRPEQLLVEYQDFTGKQHTMKFTGITSRLFQHEFDHINGVVFTERSKPVALKLAKQKRDKLLKKL